MNAGPAPGSPRHVVTKSWIHAAWVASSTFEVASPNSVAQICLPPSPLLAITPRNWSYRLRGELTLPVENLASALLVNRYGWKATASNEPPPPAAYTLFR